MDRTDGHVLSYLSLEDFAEDVYTKEPFAACRVRVDSLERIIVPADKIELVQW